MIQKDKKSVLISCLAVLVTLSACTTYQSGGELTSDIPLEAYKNFVLDPTANANRVASAVLIERLTAVGLIEKTKAEFVELNPDHASATLVAWWDETGIHSRLPFGYSIEATVVLKDAICGNPIYIGVGDHMGATHASDITGAIAAATTGLEAYKGFDPNLADRVMQLRNTKDAKDCQSPIRD